MAIDINKPLRMEYEIEGISNEIEGMLASKILFEIYNLAANIANNGGIAEFNAEWNVKHPDGVYDQDEYEAAYEHYFKEVADYISDTTRAGNFTYKLRETEPIIINFNEGYFKIHGYKEVYA